MGLRKWKDVTVGGEPMGEEVFARRYRWLDKGTYRDLLRELHPEWRAGLGKEEGRGEGREVLAMCCWYDVAGEGEGEPMGQYIWEIFSAKEREGLAAHAMRAMREACGGAGDGVELQVNIRGNAGAMACYEHMGARVVARQVDGIVIGEGAWRAPSKGGAMMRFETRELDARLAGGGSGGGREGREVVVAETMEELREAGVLAELRVAAAKATAHQAWRPKGTMPCLREGGDGAACRYVVITGRRGAGQGQGEGGVRDRGAGAGGGRPEPKAEVAFRRKGVLTEGEEERLEGMGVKGLYEALVAEKWEMPKPFREGGYGRKIWSTRARDEAEMIGDMAKVYAGITHPAVPLYMSDRAYKAATGTEFAGRKLMGEGGGCWKCGCADADTRHRYSECLEAGNLWEKVFTAWERVSGGERLDPKDEWMTVWGARWAAWGSAREKEKYGGEGLEEVFQVVHKAALQAIHEAASRRSKGGAQHMFQRMQTLVQKMVVDRAASTTAAKFKRVWEEPGYVRRGKSGVRTAGMWGAAFVRDGGRAEGGGAGRREAALAEKAEGMVRAGAMEVYTDGSGQEAGAGWGWVAVQGEEEKRARRGPVVLGEKSEGWRGAERATNNTGELTAILEALEWAASSGVGKVVIRYDSQYAACMTRGEWKAKVNKVLVDQCRKALGRAEGKGCEVGWKHVKGHSGDKWNDRADRLADEGVGSAPGGEDGEEGGATVGTEAAGGLGRVMGIVPDFRARGGKAAPREEPEAREGGGGGGSRIGRRPRDGWRGP